MTDQDEGEAATLVDVSGQLAALRLRVPDPEVFSPGLEELSPAAPLQGVQDPVDPRDVHDDVLEGGQQPFQRLLRAIGRIILSIMPAFETWL